MKTSHLVIGGVVVGVGALAYFLLRAPRVPVDDTDIAPPDAGSGSSPRGSVTLGAGEMVRDSVGWVFDAAGRVLGRAAGPK